AGLDNPAHRRPWCGPKPGFPVFLPRNTTTMPSPAPRSRCVWPRGAALPTAVMAGNGRRSCEWPVPCLVSWSCSICRQAGRNMGTMCLQATAVMLRLVAVHWHFRVAHRFVNDVGFDTADFAASGKRVQHEVAQMI